MAGAPRKGPTGRAIQVEQTYENEIYSGDELYIVWTGPIVTRTTRGQATAGSKAYTIGERAPGFIRDKKTGLRAWIIKQEHVTSRNLWGLLGSWDTRRSFGPAMSVQDVQNDVDLMDFLATHVHQVEISTGSNTDVVQTIPRPDSCWIRADTNERRIHVGTIITKPDAQIIGFRGVPIGSPSRSNKTGIGVTPFPGDPANHGQDAPSLKAMIKASLAVLAPGEKVYGGDNLSDVRIPRDTDTVITDNENHGVAIRITPEFVAIDSGGKGSSYKVGNQLDPNRFNKVK